MISLSEIHTPHADALRSILPECITPSRPLHPLSHPHSCPFKHAISIRNSQGRHQTVYVPCGHCMYCKQYHSSEWTTRFTAEATISSQVFFVTLTMDNAHYEDISVTTMQLFLKRLRHHLPQLRYSWLGEYGPRTHRAHYHILLFLRDFSHDYTKNEIETFIKSAWKRGNISVSRASISRYKYISKYCDKLFVDSNSIRRHSLRPGLGKETPLYSEILELHNQTGVTTVQTNVGILLIPGTWKPRNRQRQEDLLPTDFIPDKARYASYLLDYLNAYEKFLSRKL